MFVKMGLVALAALACAQALTIGANAQEQQEAVVEVRVWQDVGDELSIYISARPRGGSWGTLGTIALPLDDGKSGSGQYRYGDISLDVPLGTSGSTTVEVRVWQDVEDSSRIYVSARPAGGDWRVLGTTALPLDDGLSSTGRYRYGDLSVSVAVRSPVVQVPGEGEHSLPDVGADDADGPLVLQVTAGGEHSCALLATGEVICWGDGTYGQRDVPPGRYRSVTAGELHACAIRDSGEVVCWGGDSGWRVDESVDAPPGTYRSASAGDWHTCAVSERGAAVCWGTNTWGEANPPPGSYRSVSGGSHHSCGVLESGEVRCWGDNTHGQTNAPLGRFRSVHAGYNHTCGITEAGELLCWGEGDWPEGGSYRTADVGSAATCAVKDSGEQAAPPCSSCPPSRPAHPSSVRRSRARTPRSGTDTDPEAVPTPQSRGGERAGDPPSRPVRQTRQWRRRSRCGQRSRSGMRPMAAPDWRVAPSSTAPPTRGPSSCVGLPHSPQGRFQPGRSRGWHQTGRPNKRLRRPSARRMRAPPPRLRN